MRSTPKALLLAALLAGITLGIAAVLSGEAALPFFAVLLGTTAGVYLGFAIDDGRLREELLEIANIIFIAALAVLGLKSSPMFLAAGFLWHGVWDFAHHPKAVQTQVVKWYPPACVVYDWILAGFIFLRWR